MVLAPSLDLVADNVPGGNGNRGGGETVMVAHAPTKGKGRIAELKPLTLCKWCGQVIGRESRTMKCDACREWEFLLDQGWETLCRNGHKTVVGGKCETCESNFRKRSAERKAIKRAMNA